MPKHAFNTFISYNITSKLNVTSLLRIVGDRLEPVYGTTPVALDNYYTVDISAGYKLKDRVRFYVDANNIRNKKYFDILGYTTRRFNWNVGINVQY